VRSGWLRDELYRKVRAEGNIVCHQVGVSEDRNRFCCSFIQLVSLESDAVLYFISVLIALLAPPHSISIAVFSLPLLFGPCQFSQISRPCLVRC
jgi:hypothetical protein